MSRSDLVPGYPELGFRIQNLNVNL